MLTAGEPVKPKPPIRLPDGKPAISEEPIILEDPAILASKRKIADTYGVKQIESPIKKTPVQKYAESFNSKKDFTDSVIDAPDDAKKFWTEVAGFERTPTKQQLGKIWDDAHPDMTKPKTIPLEPVPVKPTIPKTPKTPKTPKVVPVEEPKTTAPVQETPVTPKVVEAPKTTAPDPVLEERVTRIAKSMADDSPDADVFESSSFAERTRKILSYDEQHIQNVVDGIEAPRENLPRNAYISVAKDIASESGDVNRINN